MKYYPLGSLRDLLDKEGVRKNRYLLAIGIIDGLIQIHRLNYVHCDLKASNILCEEIDCKREKYIRPVISDFGGARLKGSKLDVAAGYSHHIEKNIPEGIKIELVSNTEITITGIDKKQVGDFAAEIRDIRRPEPYKGKGIRYKDEHIRRKEGKKASK